jgi:hypothetical protein
MVKNQNLNPAYVVRSNLSSGRKVQNYHDSIAAAQRGFYVIPIKYLQKFFLKITRENMEIKQIWFLECEPCEQIYDRQNLMQCKQT